MKIHISETTLVEGKYLILTEETIQIILSSIQQLVFNQYEKLPSTTKLAAMAAVRAMLAYAETKETDLEKRKTIRPPKGSDPTLHLIKLLLQGVGEAVPYVDCDITVENGRISNFSFQHAGKSGGQVSADGNERIREDHSRETAGPEIS